MGRRSAAHAFMPNKYVFPGGALDAADGKAPLAADLDPTCLAKLTHRMRGRPSPAKARGLAVAALRELHEETGVLLGRTGAAGAFNLSGLVFFARAITPPGRTRRFDSRFFVADGTEAVADPSPPLDGGELLTAAWVSLEEAFGLDLPSITRDILKRLQPFLDQGCLPRPGCEVTFHHARGKQWLVESL
jgi:8-oxo-dGTP pyrophosphatase MutT (NUDIX family)